MQKEGVVALSPLRYNFITNSARLAEISLDSSEEGPSLLSQITIGTNAFIILSVILLLLLLFSAFFSSSETSFSTVNIIRLKNYVEEKKRGAKKALWIAEHFDRTLTTCLVGNNFVNIGATTVGAFLVSQLIINPTIANIVTTFAMTIIVLIFGEILPKSYAKEHPEELALFLSGFMYFLIKISYPFVVVFLWLKKALVKGKETLPTVTESELETIIETMEDQGVINSMDADLLQGVIDIGDRTVNDIMTPRLDVIGVEISMTPEEIKNLFFKYKYSRMPVYKEDRDHIIGILTERDFFTAYIKKQKIDLRTLVSTPLYVSKELKVDDLIRKMQAAKKHFAIVSDEYGGTSGIVTLEDAIEELFGEIYDEHDDDDDQVQHLLKQDDNTYIVSADLLVEELADTLELGKVPETTYPTVGGFLYGLVEELPYEGQVVDYQSFIYENDNDGLIVETPITLRFTLLSVVERRIIKARLEIIGSKKSEKNQDTKEQD